jgi:mono/diheme cytochrome c family protein
LPRMKTHFAVRAFRARPITAIAMMIAVVALSNAVLVGCGGKKAESTSDQTSTQAAPATPSGDAGTPAAAGDLGSQGYSQRCALCHGPTGHGDGPAAASLNPKPRNHTDGSYMNGRTDEQLLEVIRNGKGAMPAWKSVLSEEEIEAVLKHVRSLAVPPYKS